MVVLCLDVLDKLSLFCCARFLKYATSRCEITGEFNKEQHFLEESMIQSQQASTEIHVFSIQSRIYLLIIPSPKTGVTIHLRCLLAGWKVVILLGKTSSLL